MAGENLPNLNISVIEDNTIEECAEKAKETIGKEINDCIKKLKEWLKEYDSNVREYEKELKNRELEIKKQIIAEEHLKNRRKATPENYQEEREKVTKQMLSELISNIYQESQNKNNAEYGKRLTKLRQSFTTAIVFKNKNSNFIKKKDVLLNYLLKGQLLYDEIREKLTGHKITYVILYSDNQKGKQKQLYQASFTFEELMEYGTFSLEYNDGKLSVKLKNIKKSYENGDPFNRDRLYENLETQKEQYNNENGKKILNYGHILEVHRNKDQYQIDETTTNNKLVDLLLQSRDDKTPGRLVGDRIVKELEDGNITYYSEQLKSIAEASAELGGINTLKEAISNIVKAYEERNSNELAKQVIQTTFYEGGHDIELQKAVSESSIEKIKEVLSGIEKDFSELNIELTTKPKKNN